MEVLKPEVDNGGYDLVIECGGQVRHIQLKASKREVKRQFVDVQLKLLKKPSACVIWIMFDESTMELGPFLWLGGKPGERISDFTQLPVARHTVSKRERHALRRVKRSLFTRIAQMEGVIDALFSIKTPE